MGRTRRHTRRRPRSRPRGVLEVHAGGFGFVKTAEGEFYIPKAQMRGAFDGDLVEVAPLSAPRGAPAAPGHPPDRPQARVTEVIDRAHETLVGRYEVAEPFGVVVPEDARIPYDIFTMRAESPDVPHGSLVRVRIAQFPTRHSAATGFVEEVFGPADAAHVPTELIIARHKLETVFSEGSLSEARAAVLDAQGALDAGYRDLRGRFVFTIDPDDARDFDDAISIEWVGESAPDPSCGTAGGAGGPVAQTVLSSRESATGAFGSCGTRFVDPPAPPAPRASGARSLGQSTGPEGSWLPGSSATTGVRVVDSRGGSAACWRLGVHIADVSHYVPWDSSLDLDARRRATSVYLVDRVIPMLPEELSNDLCSLRPGEDRRTMTADLYLDDEAHLVAYELYPALIRSDARLTYGQAQELLEGVGDAEEGLCSERERRDRAVGGPPSEFRTSRNVQWTFRASSGLSERLGPPQSDRPEGVESAVSAGLVWRLAALSRIAGLRARARRAAGGLDFDTPEPHVVLDGEGRAVDIAVKRKTPATALIEEAMILANETVAAHLRDARFPCMYRVHEAPAAENLAALVPVLSDYPWFSRIDRARLVAGDGHEVARLVEESRGRPEEQLVATLVLRAMKRAVYAPACGPHYGLASAAYAHFTSPIRRYPDLVVHRMLRASICGRPEKFDQEATSIPWMAEHASKMERVADDAARDSQQLRIVEYMQQFVGQRFSATVSGVTSYGLYVRLDNLAEGLVDVRDLGREYFSLDAVRHRLVGEDTGTVYRLGQRIAVVLASADVRACHLDFKPVSDS